MPIWVFMVRYEGELSCSTHLTEKGAMLAAIGDVMEYLGVEDEEAALRVFDDQCVDAPRIEPPEWDQEKMRKMKPDQLHSILGAWIEKTWDHYDYEVEVTKTRLVG